MGLAQLGAAAADGTLELPGCESVNVTLTLSGSPDEITPQLVKGDLPLAAVPVNLAAVLGAKTDGALQLAAVNTLGVLHVVTKGVTVTSLADLAGQAVWSTGKGTTPQYVLDYLLAENDLEGQVQVEYLSEASEVAARLAAAETGVAVLPEPYVTTVTAQDPAIARALDLTDEWAKVSASPVVTGGLVVQRQWVADHAETLAAFLEAYADSVDYANDNPDEAGELIAGLGITPSAAVAAKAIPGSHLVLLTGAQAQAAASGYLAVLFAANPESVGGAIPGDDFYLTLSSRT
jgi:NitT/TauT family transport system substrate-binding protein